MTHFPAYDNRGPDRGNGDALVSAIEFMRSNGSSASEVRAFTDRVGAYFTRQGASPVEVRAFTEKATEIILAGPVDDAASAARRRALLLLS